MIEFSLFFIYTICLTISLIISLSKLYSLFIYYFLIILFIINLKNVNKIEYYLQIFQNKKIFYIFVILKI